MSTLFVDTGAWIALLKRDDRRHQEARQFYAECTARGDRFVTTNYVMDETITRLRYDAGLPAALAFRGMIERAVSSQRLRIRWVDTRVEDAAWRVMEQYADVRLSFTDATSAALARAGKIKNIFGFDKDFRALGFDVQPA